MDTCNLYEPSTELPQDYATWFAVSGDLDDFIYYEDPAKTHSEK